MNIVIHILSYMLPQIRCTWKDIWWLTPGVEEVKLPASKFSENVVDMAIVQIVLIS